MTQLSSGTLRLWTGAEPDPEVMREALRRAFAEP
jgi:hypothetical protein